MADMCTDGRFEIIAKAKEKLILCTNITEEELKVVDKFLYRCWQMGWLNKEINAKTRIALINTPEELDKAVYEKWECLPEEVEIKTFVNWLKEEVEI